MFNCIAPALGSNPLNLHKTDTPIDALHWLEAQRLQHSRNEMTTRFRSVEAADTVRWGLTHYGFRIKLVATLLKSLIYRHNLVVVTITATLYT